MDLRNYRQLQVWKDAMLATKLVYQLTTKLPPDERFGLINQMRRAAVSMPSNIAEGHARNSVKDFQRFLFIAKGSAAELETQLTLCCELDFLEEEECTEVMDLLDKISRKIARLSASIDGR